MFRAMISKKLTSLILVLCITISILSGFTACGGDNSDLFALVEAEITIEPGETKQLSVTNAGDKEITWLSSDETVVTVDNGLVRGLLLGTATITAMAGDDVAICTVHVVEDTVGAPALTLKTKAATLFVGLEYDLESILKVGKTVIDTKDITFSWETSASEVLSVNNGTIKGLIPGSARITVSCVYMGVSLSDYYDFNVNELYAMDMEKSIVIGEVGIPKSLAGSFRAYSIDVSTEGSIVDLAANQLNFTSENPSVATVDSDGIVSPNNVGTARIRISVKADSTVYVDINFVIFTGTIYTAQQFEAIFARKISPTDGLLPTEGNYILMDDIDFAGFANNNISVGLYAFRGVAGVLDGNGYSIKNVNLRRNIGDMSAGNALFWDVTGTIRNLGFENIVFNPLTSNGASMTGMSGLIVRNLSGLLENIYLQGSMRGQAGIITEWGNNFTALKAGFVAYNCTGNARLTNLIIDVDNEYRYENTTTITRVIGVGSVVATNIYIRLPAHAGFGSAGNTVINYLANNSLDALASNMQINLPSDIWNTNGFSMATLINGCILTES